MSFVKPFRVKSNTQMKGSDKVRVALCGLTILISSTVFSYTIKKILGRFCEEKLPTAPGFSGYRTTGTNSMSCKEKDDYANKTVLKKKTIFMQKKDS